MKTGMLDSRLEMHELPFYEIEGLCNAIVETAVKKSEDYRAKFEEYKRKITRFSPAFEFCLHELGWMLYDPFCLGNEEVLFSNGKRFYVASVDYVKKEGFNRTDINNDSVGYPRLEDKVVGYDRAINDDAINEGIVDSRGYVDVGFTDSLYTLAEIEVMNENIGNKESYEDFLKNRDNFETTLDYLTSKPNVIAAKKLADGTICLRFVSENDGLVQDFIDRIQGEGKLAEFIPVVKDEETHIMKAA